MCCFFNRQKSYNVSPSSLSLSLSPAYLVWYHEFIVTYFSAEAMSLSISEELLFKMSEHLRSFHLLPAWTLSEKSHYVSEQDWTWTIQTKHHCRTSDPRQQLFQSVKIKRVQPPSVPRFHTWEYNVSWRENKSSGFSWPYLNTTSDEQ